MSMQTTDQWGSLLPKGLGTDQEAQQATGAMRQSPWYQDQLKKWGVTPQGDAYGNVSLNDDQQQELYDLALKNGIGLNNKYDQIDENGQISEAHHKLRNSLIAAAIGGASLTGLGAAGIGPLSGLFGASAAPLASTTIGNGFIPAITGGTGMAAGAGTGAGLAAGAGSTMAGLLPSVGYVSPDSSMVGGAGAATSAAGGGGDILNKIMKSLGTSPDNKNPMANIASLLGSGAQGIANNRALQGGFAQNFDRNAIAAQDSGNVARDTAMHDLAVSNYLQNSHGSSPSSIQLNGQQRSLPDFGFGYKAPSADQVKGAGLLKDTALKTLGPNGTYTPQPLSSYATPGTGEDLLNAGSSIAGFLPVAGDIWKMFSK